MNIPRTNLDELIGKQFKRNKYGLSLWTDEITFVGYRSKIIDRHTRGIEFYVVGSISDKWYDFDEIVLVGQPLRWFEEIQLQKRERHEEIQLRYGNRNSITTTKPDEGN